MESSAQTGNRKQEKDPCQEVHHRDNNRLNVACDDGEMSVCEERASVSRDMVIEFKNVVLPLCSW